MLAHVWLFFMCILMYVYVFDMRQSLCPTCPLPLSLLCTRAFADYQLWWSNCVPNFYVCIHISMLVSFLYPSYKYSSVGLFIASLSLSTFAFYSERKEIHTRIMYVSAFLWHFLCGFFFYVQNKYLSNSGTTIHSLTLTHSLSLACFLCCTHRWKKRRIISAIRQFFFFVRSFEKFRYTFRCIPAKIE